MSVADEPLTDEEVAGLEPDDGAQWVAEHEEGAPAPAPVPVDYGRIKRWVIKRDGKDYITYSGLLDLLHQESGGNFAIHTEVLQFPRDDNGQVAVCFARVLIKQTEGGGPSRTATGIGDAGPKSTNAMIAAHAIRMAETRAKGRALRDLLNVGLVMAEELGGSPGGLARPVQQAPAGTPAPAPAPADDTITIDGALYSRQQVWGFYVQRMNQCKDRGVDFPKPPLTSKHPLKQISDATQTMKRRLAEAGALVPRSN